MSPRRRTSPEVLPPETAAFETLVRPCQCPRSTPGGPQRRRCTILLKTRKKTTMQDQIFLGQRSIGNVTARRRCQIHPMNGPTARSVEGSDSCDYERYHILFLTYILSTIYVHFNAEWGNGRGAELDRCAPTYFSHAFPLKGRRPDDSTSCFLLHYGR